MRYQGQDVHSDLRVSDHGPRREQIDYQSAQNIRGCHTHLTVQSTHVPTPAGWSPEDAAKLHQAISEEVARQVARIVQDPVTLCRLLLFRLEDTLDHDGRR